MIMVDTIVAAEVTGESKLWSVLMVNSELFAGTQLRHVDSLYRFLKGMVSSDEFPTVNQLYKTPLDADVSSKQELMQLASDAEGLADVIDIMKTLMVDMLGGTAVVRRQLVFWSIFSRVKNVWIALSTVCCFVACQNPTDLIYHTLTAIDDGLEDACEEIFREAPFTMANFCAVYTAFDEVLNQ